MIFHIDHIFINYLMNKPITNGRVTSWLLLLQEFDVTIINEPGKDNIVANFLSILITNETEALVEDNFPNKHISTISTNSLWYVDIINYFATRKLPRQLSPKK